MDTKLIAGVAVGAVVLGGGCFYGGMQYEIASRAGARGQFAGQGFQAGGQRNVRFAAGSGFTMGKIVSVEPTSITIDLGVNASSTNGGATGSKIVLYSASTQIGKFSTAASSDLAVGDTVTVQGSQNSDGSITAQMIQVRPEGALLRAR